MIYSVWSSLILLKINHKSNSRFQKSTKNLQIEWKSHLERVYIIIIGKRQMEILSTISYLWVIVIAIGLRYCNYDRAWNYLWIYECLIINKSMDVNRTFPNWYLCNRPRKKLSYYVTLLRLYLWATCIFVLSTT